MRLIGSMVARTLGATNESSTTIYFHRNVTVHAFKTRGKIARKFPSTLICNESEINVYVSNDYIETDEDIAVTVSTVFISFFKNNYIIRSFA